MKSGRLFTVKGRVQGVFFRDSTRRIAESLGLTGYAVNLPDGNVEVLACGDVVALDELEAWLHEGPRMASVTEVTASDTDFRPQRGFTIG